MGSARLAIVIPVDGSETRLALALESLGHESFGPDELEVIVVRHGRLVGQQAAAPDGLCLRRLDQPAIGLVAALNRAWRASDAPVVAFLHDDCRPSGEWRRVVADLPPVPLVLGRIELDPDERHLRGALTATVQTGPPGPWLELANLICKRELLNDLGGFDEALTTSRAAATDLGLRARAMGVRPVVSEQALIWQAVRLDRVRREVRGAGVVAAAAEMVALRGGRRRLLTGRLFARPSHALWLGAACSARISRSVSVALLMLYFWLHLSDYDVRADPVRPLAELPSRAAADGVEIALALAAGARRRTALL